MTDPRSGNTVGWRCFDSRSCLDLDIKSQYIAYCHVKVVEKGLQDFNLTVNGIEDQHELETPFQ